MSSPPPRIPMVDLAARYRAAAAEIETAALSVLRSGRWVGGPWVRRCEEELAAHFGRRLGVGLNSGTDALALALQALGVGAGDEVLVPAVTFFATAGAVARIGARPVVVDVLEDRPLLDPAAARAALGPRTRAAIPVHLFGMCCPDPQLPLPLVEDSAQAAGLSPPPRLGSCTAVSLYPTKSLGAAGDGGLLATDDADLAHRVRRLANHGADPHEPHLHHAIRGHVGTNSRLDSMQAAVAVTWLPHLPERVARRRWVARTYDRHLPPGTTAVDRTSDDPYHQYILRTPHREALRAHLHRAGVDTAVYYPRPLSSQPALAPQSPVPRADTWCRELLSLPCRASLADGEVERITTALSEFTP